MEIHLRDKVWEKAKTDGEYILEVLNKELSDNPKIKTIRGIGMEIGVLFNDDVDVKSLNQKFFDASLLVAVDGNNLQIMPPLTIERNVLDQELDIFVKTIK